jgi:hypothetical protein
VAGLLPLLVLMGFGVELSGRISTARDDVRRIDNDLRDVGAQIELVEATLNATSKDLGPREDVINASPRLSNGAVNTFGGESGHSRVVLYVGLIQPTVDDTPGSNVTGAEAMVIRNAVLVASHAQRAVVGGLPKDSRSRLVPITIEDSTIDKRIELGENVKLQNVTFAHFP